MYSLIHMSLRQLNDRMSYIRNQRRARRNNIDNGNGNNEVNNIIGPSISLSTTAQQPREQPLRSNGTQRGHDSRDDDDDDDDDEVPAVARTVTNPSSSNRNSSNPSSVPFLYTLSTRWAWNAVLYRCETHPDEATSCYRDLKSGDTCLHWSCFGVAPLNVIDKLIEVNPQLPKITNTIGQLPIHVACSYRSSSNIIKSLIQAYPDSVRIPTSAGKSQCLHILCDYGCSIQSLQYVLETKEGASTIRDVDKLYCRTPIYILHERKNISQFYSTITELRNIRCQQRIITNDISWIIQQQKQEHEHEQCNEDDACNDGCDETTTTIATVSTVHLDQYQKLQRRLQQLQDEYNRLEHSALRYHDWDYWQKARRLIISDYLDRAITNDDIAYVSDIIHMSSVNDDDHWNDTVESDWDDTLQIHHQQGAVGATSSTGKQRGCSVVHACISVMDRCPPSLLELALLLTRPEELLLPYENNNLKKKNDHQNEKEGQGQLPLHLACSISDNTSVILDVLLANPKAACIPDTSVTNGNLLPFSIFLNRQKRKNSSSSSKIGWCNLIEEFIVANPLSVLAAFDEADDERSEKAQPVDVGKMYPTLLSRWSSVADPKTRQRNVRVLYELIRGNPSIFAT